MVVVGDNLGHIGHWDQHQSLVDRVLAGWLLQSLAALVVLGMDHRRFVGIEWIR